MPVVSVPGLRRMAAMNGTLIPPDLEGALDRAGDDARAVAEVGVEVATRLCEDLLRAGAPGLHLYTLNRAASVRRIWENLGSEVARVV
jgi:methylenetetrahydrofolate reductase (NADPH)